MTQYKSSLFGRALKTGALAGAFALTLAFSAEASTWTLEEAAAPYKGVTIRTIGVDNGKHGLDVRAPE